MQKTFDQLRKTLSEDELLNHELTHTSKAFRTFVVLEPMIHQDVTRVSVSARDENMDKLWGSTVSEGMLGPGDPTPVALYAPLRNLIREYLQAPKPRHEITDDPYQSIEFCLKEVDKMLELAKTKTLNVKNRSDKTDERATLVADLLWDTLRQLNLKMGSFGLKGAGE